MYTRLCQHQHVKSMLIHDDVHTHAHIHTYILRHTHTSHTLKDRPIQTIPYKHYPQKIVSAQSVRKVQLLPHTSHVHVQACHMHSTCQRVCTHTPRTDPVHGRTKLTSHTLDRTDLHVHRLLILLHTQNVHVYTLPQADKEEYYR